MAVDLIIREDGVGAVVGVDWVGQVARQHGQRHPEAHALEIAFQEEGPPVLVPFLLLFQICDRI